MAIRLDAPGEEPVRLRRIELDQSNVAWSFPVQELEAGPWLIYPNTDSPLLFRPMLWTLSAKQSSKGVTETRGLVVCDIIKIADAANRCEQLDLAIRRMSYDFSHSDWHTMEQLADQLYHLPLSTLDVWRVFAHSPVGLAALALRANRFPAGFLERFSTEMPAVWETVPLTAWVDAMSAYLAFEDASSITTLDLNSRVEAIASLHPSLRVLLEVAQTLSTGSSTQSVRFAQVSHWDFAKNLFVGKTPLISTFFGKAQKLNGRTISKKRSCALAVVHSAVFYDPLTWDFAMLL